MYFCVTAESHARTEQETSSKNVNSGKFPTALLFLESRASLRIERRAICKTMATRLIRHLPSLLYKFNLLFVFHKEREKLKTLLLD